jgi:hypothetical protein
MLKALLHKILPPREVRETIYHIDDFLKANAVLSKTVLRRKAVKLAMETEKTVTFITRQYHQPEHLALLLITNVIGEIIAGKKFKKENKNMARDMLAMWDIATEQMREKRYYSTIEYQRDCDWINKRCTWLRTNISE